MRSVVRSLNQTYEATPASVGEGRARLTEFAAAAGAAPDQVEAVRLASSEAMTNVVLHAYRGAPGAIYVNAAVVSEELWVLIADDGCGLQPRADRPGLGLGLGLIAQISDDFAIVSRASGGTEVRIRFDLEPAPSSERSARPPAVESRSPAGHAPRRPGFTPSASIA
ncbi:MAG: ATP-binding protein [Solirubrobacteraceae bacterium]